MKEAELLLVLIEARKALEKANEDGPICDTIWMPGRPETLFDFLDVAIEKATSAQAMPPRAFAVVARRRLPSGRYSYTVESDVPLPIGAPLHTDLLNTATTPPVQQSEAGK